MKHISLLALSTIALVPVFTHAMEVEKKPEALVDLDFSKLNYPGLYAAQAHPVTMQATAAQKELRLNFVQLHNKTKDKPLLTYINFWYEGFKLLSRRSKACHTLATSHFSNETTFSAVLNSCFAPSQDSAQDPITPQKVFGDVKKELETLIAAAEGKATPYGREDGVSEIMPLWKRMLLNHNPYKLLGGTISIVASLAAMIKAKDDPALTPVLRSIACGLCGIVQIAGVGIIKHGINEYYKNYQKAHKRISSLVEGVTSEDTVLVDIEKTTTTKMIPA